MNNTTLDQSSIPPMQPLGAVLYVTSVLVSGWTVGANAVILACFYLNRNTQLNNFCHLTKSMTISDLFVGLVWAIQLGLNLNKGRMIRLICNTSLYLIASLQLVSLYHVLGICVLRNKVLRSKNEQGLDNQQRRWTLMIMIISWILPMVVIGISIVTWARFGVDIIICSLDVVFGDNMETATFFACTFYLTSQFVTNILYCMTVVKLWLELRKSRMSVAPAMAVDATTEEITSENTNATGTSIAAHMRMLKYQKDITSTIGYLLLLFNILTLPKTIGGYLVGSSKATEPNTILLTTSLFILNSGVNPIVYAMRIPWIKDSIKRIAVGVTKCFRVQR